MLLRKLAKNTVLIIHFRYYKSASLAFKRVKTILILANIMYVYSN